MPLLGRVKLFCSLVLGFNIEGRRRGNRPPLRFKSGLGEARPPYAHLTSQARLPTQMRCYSTLKTAQALTDLQQEQRKRLALVSEIFLLE